MSAELLTALEDQCAAEGEKKRSPFLSQLLSLLLTSDIGQSLREQARVQQRIVGYGLNLLNCHASLKLDI